MNEVTAYTETAKILRDQLREAVIDHPAFERKIRPCELQRCRATCCHDGVYLSEEEADGIKRLIDDDQAFASELPPEPVVRVRAGKSMKTTTRLAESHELAVDYPAHFPETRCVFLDDIGQCKIQLLSIEQGRHAWFDKPLTCWIHPLVILPATRDRLRPVLTLVDEKNDPQKSDGYPGFASCTHCGREDEDGKKARQVLAAELEMLGKISGRDILAELNAEEAT